MAAIHAVSLMVESLFYSGRGGYFLRAATVSECDVVCKTRLFDIDPLSGRQEYS